MYKLTSAEATRSGISFEYCANGNNEKTNKSTKKCVLFNSNKIADIGN